MKDGGKIPLSQHYRTLADKKELIGLKVYDENNDEYIYIKDVENGIWAGKNKNDELGHYYDMSDLMIDSKKKADGGYMKDGGEIDTSDFRWSSKKRFTEEQLIKNGYKKDSPSSIGRSMKNIVAYKKPKNSNVYEFTMLNNGKLKYYNSFIREGHMKEGGNTTFDDKVDAISKTLIKRKKVPASVQKDYGKEFSRKEAIESAKRIAGAMRKKEMAKKSK